MTTRSTVRAALGFAAFGVLVLAFAGDVTESAAKLTYVGPEHLGVGMESQLTVVHVWRGCT